ncbi:tyrosine-type recombinase/integrase [Rhodobacter sp. 24-YEA-8]|uniref:tyrosine-type recombinase/integrase n=1 Tax=Rhodobacter sp. 24-YEA-8 TaxID=1884310 RepID=UPI00089AF551|nr:tyrosine-type recombinase/integrase [Rhodobacter sp. 24-YEA-8]SEB61980.1 Phage integrase family protein [Rhodobacter sp. 24-YEA-8]
MDGDTRMTIRAGGEEAQTTMGAVAGINKALDKASRKSKRTPMKETEADKKVTTQKDMRNSFFHPKNGIDTKFGKIDADAFDDPRIRRKVLEWRDKIGGKVGDDRLRHLQRLVKFGIDRAMILQNHLRDIPALYSSDRAEIMWSEAEIDDFVAGAPPQVGRILIVATETGLRPGDLVRLTRDDILPTPHGRRIVLRTRKRGRLASIPVTPRLAALIDDMPKHQTYLIINKGGEAYSHENYLGDSVSEWRDKLKMRKELRLYDARGTAATRLLAAGAELKEIAVAMGWSIKHAAEVIENYVALSPQMADGIGDKLARLRDTTGTKL